MTGTDPLHELLRDMTLSGAVFLDAEFTAPWCIASKVTPEDCRPFMPVPAQLIAYHYVIHGQLLLKIEDREPVVAKSSDLIILPRNDLHILGSQIDLPPANADDLVEPADEKGLARIRYGGGGAPTQILCGFLGSNDPNHPLILSLPPILKLTLDDGAIASWIEGSMRYAACELARGGPGASLSLARLSELLLAEAIRTYARRLPQGEGDWLAGLCDPYVGRALSFIHRKLAYPWRLEELAREVGLSRSALGDRFIEHVGVSPMRYLSRRRLQEAADQLRNSRRPVAQIAYDIGYESEAAFSRSFKREFGIAPVAFRASVDRIPSDRG
jgi:AraC-like DNA-binding protein